MHRRKRIRRVLNRIEKNRKKRISITVFFKEHHTVISVTGVFFALAVFTESTVPQASVFFYGLGVITFVETLRNLIDVDVERRFDELLGWFQIFFIIAFVLLSEDWIVRFYKSGSPYFSIIFGMLLAAVLAVPIVRYIKYIVRPILTAIFLAVTYAAFSYLGYVDLLFEMILGAK